MPQLMCAFVCAVPARFQIYCKRARELNRTRVSLAHIAQGITPKTSTSYRQTISAQSARAELGSSAPQLLPNIAEALAAL